MTVRFTVLGPVEVHAKGKVLPGLAPRHRAALAYLLLHAGTVIGVERLMAALWGDTQPDTARSQIHAAVTAIRRVLRTAGAVEQLATRHNGYVVTPHSLDLDDFTGYLEAAHEAANDPLAAVDRLRCALGLWRGEALADITGDYVAGARARLEERRLVAWERLADLELSRGRHEELAGELSERIEAYPLREKLVGQHMRALNASGRQADALTAGRDYRERLADQQGLDPGAHFLALEQAILRGQASGAATNGPPNPFRRTANYLPYDVPDFTGRTIELDRIVSGPAACVCSIDGMPGVGKTSLAVHASHRLADRYGDGQLFVDMRAHTEGQAPVTASGALHTLLRQLGVPAEHIPAELAERSAIWRAELASRAVVVVVDNAADTEQIRPLLPGATRSLILVTSRRRLTDLDGARSFSLDVLPATDAVNLFTSIVGERARADFPAVADVLRLCGNLPLAVRIAAGRLHHRPQWTVAFLADRLRDERRRLTELATAERGVAAAFTMSYQNLPAAQQRYFRLLGLHPGRDFDTRAAATLAGMSDDDAETALEQLLDSHMLAQRELGRYTFHDLLREHARAATAAEDDEPTRRAALGRLLDYYTRTAATAIDILYPDTKHRRPLVPPPEPMPAFSTAAAVSWLDAERANLAAVSVFAVDRDWTAHAMNMGTILYRYLYNNVHDADAQNVYAAALAAGKIAGDHQVQSRSLSDLGWLSFARGGYASAQEHFEQATEHAAAAGDDTAHARALHGLASTRQRRDDDAEAMTHFKAALDLFRKQNDQFGQAVALNSLGALHEEAGRSGEAFADLTQARALFRQLGTAGGEADVLNNLGQVHRRQGRRTEAHDSHQQALAIYQRSGIRRGEARSHNGLGAVAVDSGDADKAREHYEAALAIACDLNNRLEQAHAHEGLAHLAAGNLASDAGSHAAMALALYAQLGERERPALRRLAAQPDRGPADWA